MLKRYPALMLKRKESKHGKRVSAYKGGKSKEKQFWDFMIKRKMLDHHLLHRA